MNTAEPTRFLGSNLKMANDRTATMALLDAAAELARIDQRQYFFFPSMVFVAEAVERVAGTSVLIGSQGCSTHAAGAYTGEVSAAMLAQVGAQTVMVGHYERVKAGETLATFIEQGIRAQEAGLRVLCCLGEPTQATVAEDASDVLADVDALQEALPEAPWVLAYEPHWAIGEHGRRPETEYVAARLVALRAGLDARGWIDVPVVYGGSVDADNAATLDALPGCAGLFVGRAAWTPDGLRTIAHRTGIKEGT